jgi:monovalent cation/hydrogen antiporter
MELAVSPSPNTDEASRASCTEHASILSPHSGSSAAHGPPKDFGKVAGRTTVSLILMIEPQALLQLVLLLLSLVLALGAFAKRLPIPYPIALVLGGLVLALVPGLPVTHINKDVVFTVFLPPVIWAAAYESDLRQLRRSAVSIAWLAVGLVVVTTVVVALVAHAVMPDMAWASAFILGAVVSSTDSVAATAVAQRLCIPRPLIALLEGESLLNDASSLVLYHTAVVARVTGHFTPGAATVAFIYDSIIGVAVGIGVAYLVRGISRLTRDSLSTVALTLIAAYVSWILGEKANASAVLSCVACGLTMRRHILTSSTALTRVKTDEVWNLFVFILNGFIFVLLGLEWPRLVVDLPPGGLRSIALPAALVCLTVIVIRLAWTPLAVYGNLFLLFLPRHRRPPAPPKGWLLVSGWTGMRGIVTLATALAVPTVSLSGQPLSYRGRIVIISFSVILVTLVLQGLTLAPLIKSVGLVDDGEGARELALARQTALDASVEKLDAIRSGSPPNPQVIEMLRAYYAARAARTREMAAAQTVEAHALHLSFFAQRQELVDAQRQSVIRLWKAGSITDQTLANASREIDLEELMFAARSEDGG